MTSRTTLFDRRQMLLGTAAMVSSSMMGCRSSGDAESNEPPSSVRPDVPLRILLVGSDQDADAMTRGWNAIAEQPLTIKTISPTRDTSQAMAEAVLSAATECDVLIYPLLLVSELDATDSITPFSDEEVQQHEASAGDLYPSLRSGAARYSGKHVGTPLGAMMPALIAGAELPETEPETSISWQDYDAMVEAEWGGSASEPSAPGWAGAMFLWRASNLTPWLFDRETLEPVIATEPYIQTLEQMQATHERYRAKLQTPDAIWRAVASGELKGGIGFPLVRNQTDGEPAVIQTPPGVENVSRILLDPFCPIGSLSINCRQSRVAKQFLQWISGGEGSAATRNQIAGMTDSRTQIAPTDTSVGSSGTPGYDRWLTGRLSTPVTLPTLQIRQGAAYYDILDQQIGRALRAETESRTALEEVSARWREMTQQVGADPQRRAWRRAQGMRG